MRSPLIALPVKPFGVAKRRLSPVLDARQRSRLGREVAARTIGAAQATGAVVAVVTGDAGVRLWARDLGVATIDDRRESLDVAGSVAVAAANRQGRPWIVAHADLPLVAASDFVAIIEALERADVVIAPSYDGGTSVLAGTAGFAFRYGRGSFRRHLGTAQQPIAVVVRLGLALDLDGPSDLAAAAHHPRGCWLSEYLSVM
jgi:2-phospho-L-lactate guanylyltransferase